MPDAFPMPPAPVLDALRDGLAIPAHPLALTAEGALDERHQRALTRYYHAAGAGGLAVGVHTTQFEIREPGVDLLEPVLALAADTLRACDDAAGRRTVRIAGRLRRDEAGRRARPASPPTSAITPASSPSPRSPTPRSTTSSRTAARSAQVIPLVGFYLQPAVGGRVLPVDFWRAFAEIPNVVAIKVAPFDRYQTLDVVRAVAESGRADEIALYTGNDDHILLDLLTTYEIPIDGGTPDAAVRGRACSGTGRAGRAAPSSTSRSPRCIASETPLPASLLTLAAQITEANAALFDPAHQFAGCIAGIHEVLHRQGLMASTRCLNPHEALSPGQSEAIDRIYRLYPHLTDDAFVAEHLDEWLR